MHVTVFGSMQFIRITAGVSKSAVPVSRLCEFGRVRKGIICANAVAYPHCVQHRSVGSVSRDSELPVLKHLSVMQASPPM